MENLAINSLHLTLKLLEKQLKNIDNKDLQVYIYHQKINYYDQISKELSNIDILNKKIEFLSDDNMIEYIK